VRRGPADLNRGADSFMDIVLSKTAQDVMRELGTYTS